MILINDKFFVLPEELQKHGQILKQYEGKLNMGLGR